MPSKGVDFSKHDYSPITATRGVFDLQFDARTKPVDNRYQAVDGEPSEVGVRDSREIGCGDPGGGRGLYAQSLVIGCLNDFCCEVNLKLLDVRILVSEVAKDISESSHYRRLSDFFTNWTSRQFFDFDSTKDWGDGLLATDNGVLTWLERVVRTLRLGEQFSS